MTNNEPQRLLLRAEGVVANMSATNTASLINLYRNRSKGYDFSAKLFPVVGFRQNAYRKQAINTLHLKIGDTVIDIGCGTGLNFPLLQRGIGPSGRIIGVDVTDKMLDLARDQVKAKGWSNVELVQSDAAGYDFPPHVDGIISTFTITLVPEFDDVIRRASGALMPGRRLVVLDFKLPDNWLARFAPLLEHVLTRPFGGTLDMADHHPWESILKYLRNVNMKNLYMGCAYIAYGERSGR